jgi:hypothetical protein
MTIFQRGFFIGLLVISFLATNYVYNYSRTSENSPPSVTGEDHSVASEINDLSDMPEDDSEAIVALDQEVSLSEIKKVKKEGKKSIVRKSKVSRRPSSVKAKNDIPWGRVPSKSAAKK